MRIRSSLTAGAIAAVAAIAFAVPGVTAAAQPAPNPSYHTASGQATTGKVSGIIPARAHNSQKFAAMVNKVGVHAAAAAPTVACPSGTGTEPNCPLVYNGGPVQHTPKVYVVFWGSKWNTAAAASAKSYITGFYTGLGLTGKGDFWSGIVKQYGDTSGKPVTINTSMLGGTWVDTSLPANSATNPVSLDAVAQEAFNGLVHFNLPDPTQANIVVASQQGTCFAPLLSSDPTSVFAGNCGTPATTAGSQYCGFHAVDGLQLANGSLTYLPWTTLPYQPDAQADCTFPTPTSVNDGFSIVGGHEAMETVTDPETTPTTLAWDDQNDPSGGEVADKCAWVAPQLNLALNGHSYAMQSLWSNVTNGCATTGALGLKITTPAAQSSTLGKAISPLQITATTTAPTPLTYTAAGLPPGLSVNKTTGMISGTPGVTAGTFTAKVTVAYYYSQGTVSFTWKVASAAGNIKGWASKCVADYQAKTTAGARIVLWPCAATASMNVTFGSNNQLSVVGRCITGTVTVFIEPCSAIGAKYQHWTRLSNGEYQLLSNGECLTAPGQATGLQLVTAACKNAGNQRWSLP